MAKNKLGVILIIVLLVILLLSFGVGFFLLYKTIQKGSKTDQQEVPVVENKIDRKDIAIFPVGENSIVTNLLEGPDGQKHVIKIKVNLGINSGKKEKKKSEALKTLLSEQVVFLEDVIIGICRNKTFEELRRNDAQFLLANEIQKKLSEAFDTELIAEVIINELILD